MTSPESPAVQDTDRLREVAAEAEALRRNGPASDGRGWYRTEADRVECFAVADAVLAAVLPVHREIVLREAASPLAALSRWIDDHPANATRDPEARAWGRIAKIGEEAGEVIAAMIAVTGQNPRKPASGTWDDVQKELLDVAVTALGAHEHLTGNQGGSMATFAAHLERVCARAGIAVSAPPPPPGSPPADERATAVETGRGGACCASAVESDGHCHEPGCLYLLGLQTGRTERDRLALDLQARDTAVREADRLREQVMAGGETT